MLLSSVTKQDVLHSNTACLSCLQLNVVLGALLCAADMSISFSNTLLHAGYSAPSVSIDAKPFPHAPMYTARWKLLLPPLHQLRIELLGCCLWVPELPEVPLWQLLYW